MIIIIKIIVIKILIFLSTDHHIPRAKSAITRRLHGHKSLLAAARRAKALHTDRQQDGRTEGFVVTKNPL